MCLSLSLLFAGCGNDSNTNNNFSQSKNSGSSSKYSSNSTGVNNNSSNNGNNINIPTANSFEELERSIANDIEQTINQLSAKWQSLKSEIVDYDDYMDNANKIEDFYDEINETVENACIRLQKYTVQYAELIMESNISNDDKYDAFEDLLDCIYEDATDDLYDDVYGDLLDDMQEVLYEGALDNSDDAPSYSDWIDIRSDEYSNWLDTRLDVYSNWLDTRSDIYSFFLDMRSELWGNDLERAEEIFDDYKEDVEKLS